MQDEPRIGLVAPLPPQIGGVASVAEWLLAHEDEIGCRYETFDLWRPPEGRAGGRLTPRDALRQLRLLGHFAAWVRTAPMRVHYSVSATSTGLARDVAFIGMLRLARRRVIGHIHIVPEEGRPRRLIRFLDRFVTSWVALAPTPARLLAELGIDAVWVPNPVRVRPNAGRGNGSSGPLRLLFVGRYGKRKGCPELVEALARARAAGADATLRFVGQEEHDGEEEALRRAVGDRRLDDAVEFAGVAAPSALATHFESADVICLPSKLEGLPLALLEGMAFGLPALATPVGGIADFVETGENGLLVEPGDIDGLADSIRLLADDPGLRARLGEEARRRVRATTGDQELARRWREVYAACEERRR
jgi:glycosyltransferase involved in cell wall biosynthesis